MSQPSSATGEQIAAARLRIVLDEKFGRVTPDTVRRIAAARSPRHGRPESTRSVPIEHPYTAELTLETAPKSAVMAMADALARDGGFSEESGAEIALVVDETYSTLVAVARQDSAVHWRFAVTDDSFAIAAEVDTRDGAVVDGDSFAWHIVRHLTDELSLSSDGRRVRAELTKHRTSLDENRTSHETDVSSEDRTAGLDEPAATEPPLARLTARERQVLELIASGRSQKEIADSLALSRRTVRNHLSNIATKLRTADSTQATVRAPESNPSGS